MACLVYYGPSSQPGYDFPERAVADLLYLCHVHARLVKVLGHQGGVVVQLVAILLQDA